MSRAVVVLLLGLANAIGDGVSPAGQPAEPAVIGLDHIPVAVRDLAAAAARYRALGFALKPGRPHPNGIRNEHVKFPDGTEIELITAPDARDTLTAKYRRHLEKGDGPAFLAFYTEAPAQVASALDRLRIAHRRSGASVDIADSEPLDYVFFGPRNKSPTDRPEHFAHANTAESLIGVWLAADDMAREAQVLERMGATIADRACGVPRQARCRTALLREGEVVLLPASHQQVAGRRIVGATLRVRSLAEARRVLEGDAAARQALERSGAQGSLVLPPAVTHGLWLELRER